MDAQKKGESLERLREEALARRVGEAFDRLAPGDAGECPDAGLLAAYHERALEPDELAQWEVHFAACSRCRKILTVLAASADAPLAENEVARLGELVTAGRHRESHSAKPQQRRPWRWQWLAPALGAAAVIAAWFAMRPPWRSLPSSSSQPQTLIAEGPKPAADINGNINGYTNGATPAPANKLSSEGTRRESNARAAGPEESRAVKPSGSSEPNTVGGITSSVTLSNPEKEKIAPDAGRATSSAVTQDSLANKKQEQAESNAAASPPAAAAATAKSPPPPRSALRPSLQGQAEAQAVAPAANAPADAAAQAGAAPRNQVQALNRTVEVNPAAGAFGGAANATDFKILRSPTGAVSWRVGKNGAIERSTNAGRTWIRQQSPLQEDWLAGAAVSDAVCWLVGRNGAIARTVDGQAWEKIASSALSAGVAGKLPDWMGITATGAQSATIISSDQRRYTTQDGGKTWRAE